MVSQCAVVVSAVVVSLSWLSMGADWTADAFFDGDEVQARLIEAIQQLPEKQRTVFNMRYYDEMKYAEISEILGTSVGGLKASYHHAAKKIEHFFREASV